GTRSVAIRALRKSCPRSRRKTLPRHQSKSWKAQDSYHPLLFFLPWVCFFARFAIDQGFAMRISCRQLSPDNCLLLADFGAFWQLQETRSPPCEGEPFGLGNLCPACWAEGRFDFCLVSLNEM